MATATLRALRRGGQSAAVGRVLLADVGSASADGFHRSWVMLFPEGSFEHEQYGHLDFTHRRLADIKANFDRRVRHIDIALDANHDQDKATGWLEALELREAGRDPHTGEAVPAGLWGRVRWTPLGLRYLKDQIYRYFSPEFGPWKDPENGKEYKDVLLGGGLTNRPFLKRMSAVQLSDVSTRPWSQVDKTCLPDSAFLDPKNRRLPIYEGTGPTDAKGRYTQRGKLNINGVKAARAAVGGAHTGTPMTGLPAGTAAKLDRLWARYGGGGDGKDGGEKAGQKQMFDKNADTHGAMTCAEGESHSHGKYDAHYHTNDADHSAAPLDGEGEQDYSDHLAARKRRGAMTASEGKAGRTGMAVRRLTAAEIAAEHEQEDDGEEYGDETDEEQDGDELLSEDDAGMTFAAAAKKSDGKDGKGKKKAAPADDEDAADGGADDAEEGDDGEQYDDTPDYNPDTSSDYTMDDEPDPPEDDEEDVTDDVLEKGTPTEGTSGRASSKTARGPGHSTKTMMPTPPAKGGKMSVKASEGRGMRMDGNGSMTLAELQAEVVRLRERDVQNSYKLYTRDVDDTLAKWEKGQRITLSEKDGAGKRIAQQGRVALTPAFKRAYREYMLREGFKLSETHRSGVQQLIEQALSCAVVDLSTRGAAFDQETRRTLRDGNQPGKRGPGSAQQSVAVEQEVKRLAEAEGKTLSDLDGPQTYSLYMRAAEAVGYR